MSSPTNADLAKSIMAIQADMSRKFERMQEMMLAGFSDLRAAMEFGFAKHDARFDQVDRKLAEHDGRFANIDGRFDRLESRIEDLETARKKRR